MAEEKILQNILDVMEREAASQRSKPVKLGNAAVGKQIEQLENAGKVASILLSLKEDILAIPASIVPPEIDPVDIREEADESTDNKETVNAFAGLRESIAALSLNVDSIKTGFSNFGDSIKSGLGDLKDNLGKVGDSIKSFSKKVGSFLKILLIAAASIALAVKFFQGFFQTEGTLGEKIQGGLDSLLELLPEPMRNGIKEVFSGIGEALDPYIQQIKGFLDPIWTELKSWFNETLKPQLKQGFSDLVNFLIEEVKKLLGLAKDKVKETVLTGNQGVDSETGTGLLEGKSGAAIGAVGGAAAGAKMGAMLGSVIPGAGTLAGAAVGALIGGAAGAITGFVEKDEFVDGVKGNATDAIARTLGLESVSDERAVRGRRSRRVVSPIDGMVTPIPNTGTQLEVESQAKEVRNETVSKLALQASLGGFNGGSSSEQKNITQNNTSNTYIVSGLQEQPAYSN